jgi:hypothetical protein
MPLCLPPWIKAVSFSKTILDLILSIPYIGFEF